MADSPAAAKNLLSKISTLNNNANSVTAQPPKYHHPNVFSSFIRQRFAAKILRYTVLIHVDGRQNKMSCLSYYYNQVSQP